MLSAKKLPRRDMDALLPALVLKDLKGKLMLSAPWQIVSGNLPGLEPIAHSYIKA